MQTPAHTLLPDTVELLADDALDPRTLASGCHVTLEWIAARVQAGVLEPVHGDSAATWRFASATLTRARRIAHLERTFDADPQLAALATDLMEEVARLRRLLALAE